MGPIAFSLCHKPVLGLFMYLASACVFPPLFEDEPLALQQANASFTKQFEAPVGTAYYLALNFHYASATHAPGDELVGWGSDDGCTRDEADIPASERVGRARPIPLHVVVRETATGTVKVNRVFNTQCMASASYLTKSRAAARFDLAAGHYVIEVRNLARQAGIDDLTTTVSLVPGRAK